MEIIVVPWDEAAYVVFRDHWHNHMDVLGKPHDSHVSRTSPHMTTVTLDHAGNAEVHFLYDENNPEEAALADKFKAAFGA